MWLWYLELYLMILAAFGLGALVGLVAVQVVVRLRADDPSLGAEVARHSEAPEPGATEAAS